jgi:hypothetical protein
MQTSKPGVTTLAFGSWPKQKHEKVQVESATRESQLHTQECEGMNPHSQVDSHFGKLNPYGTWIFIEVF